MPIIESTYHPNGFYGNMHYATIYNNTLRPVKLDYDQRERLELSDGDFIDLDWKFAKKPTKELLVMLHGWEGNSYSLHVLGMAKHMTEAGHDVVTINYRGCSGESNRLFQMYHAGLTADLDEALQHISKKKKYTTINIKGFSIGGNILMLYLGRNKNIPPEVKAAMAVSAPNSLLHSCDNQSKLKNVIYAKNFLRTMKKKLKQKALEHPSKIDVSDVKKIKTLTDYDYVYTTKAFDFKDPFDYYKKSSSSRVLKNIEVPFLLLSAKNDSFLSKKCFPYEVAKKSSTFYLETPEYGGHLGFSHTKDMTFNEERALDFFKKIKANGRNNI